MKQANKIDLWVERSFAQLMKLTDEIDLINSGESTLELSEIPIFQPLPQQAEASDYLSINEWMRGQG